MRHPKNFEEPPSPRNDYIGKIVNSKSKSVLCIVTIFVGRIGIRSFKTDNHIDDDFTPIIHNIGSQTNKQQQIYRT